MHIAIAIVISMHNYIIAMAKCTAYIIFLAGLTLLKGIPAEILAAVSFLLRKKYMNAWLTKFCTHTASYTSAQLYA